VHIYSLAAYHRPGSAQQLAAENLSTWPGPHGNQIKVVALGFKSLSGEKNHGLAMFCLAFGVFLPVFPSSLRLIPLVTA
jgi:hypothetical protein